MQSNGNKKRSSIFAYDEEKKNNKTLTLFLKIFIVMFCIFALIEGVLILSAQMKEICNITDDNVSKNNYVYMDVEEVYGPVSAKVSVTKFQGYYVLAKDKTTNNYYVLYLRDSICDKYLELGINGEIRLLEPHITGTADDLSNYILNEVTAFSDGAFADNIGKMIINVNDRGVLFEGISYICVAIIFAIFIIPRKRKK